MGDLLSGHIARAGLRLPALAEMTPDALAPLLRIVGQTRIVAIGESFHHTHEQLVLRDHFVRHLISQLGFNVILLEVITPGANPVDAFVCDGIGDAESALIAAGARMWRNQETASLIRWVREHNLDHPVAPVSVRGLDVLAIGPAMRAVLEHVDTADRRRISALSYGFDIDGRADQAAYNQLSAEDRTTVHRTFAQASAAILDQADPAYEQALVVLDALEMLRAGAQGWTSGFALRDRAMANAACRLIDRAPACDKFIILSHNTHIAAQASETAPSHPPMGAFLRERYGDQYFTLGMTFGCAAFDPPIYGVASFAGEADCADQYLASLGYPAALVDLRDADQGQRLWLAGVGVGPAPYTEYSSLRAFDALAYVDLLTNARQLIDTELSLDAKAVDATRN